MQCRPGSGYKKPRYRGTGVKRLSGIFLTWSREPKRPHVFRTSEGLNPRQWIATWAVPSRPFGVPVAVLPAGVEATLVPRINGTQLLERMQAI